MQYILEKSLTIRRNGLAMRKKVMTIRRKREEKERRREQVVEAVEVREGVQEMGARRGRNDPAPTYPHFHTLAHPFYSLPLAVLPLLFLLPTPVTPTTTYCYI